MQLISLISVQTYLMNCSFVIYIGFNLIIIRALLIVDRVDITLVGNIAHCACIENYLVKYRGLIRIDMMSCVGNDLKK